MAVFPDTLLSLFININVAIIADDCNVPSSNNPYANLWLGLGNVVNKIWFVTAKKKIPQVIGHPSPVIFVSSQVPIVVTLVPRPKKDGFMLYAQGTEESMVRFAEYLKGAL